MPGFNTPSRADVFKTIETLTVLRRLVADAAATLHVASTLRAEIYDVLLNAETDVCVDEIFTDASVSLSYSLRFASPIDDVLAKIIDILRDPKNAPRQPGEA